MNTGNCFQYPRQQKRIAERCGQWGKKRVAASGVIPRVCSTVASRGGRSPYAAMRRRGGRRGNDPACGCRAYRHRPIPPRELRLRVTHLQCAYVRFSVAIVPYLSPLVAMETGHCMPRRSSPRRSDRRAARGGRRHPDACFPPRNTSRKSAGRGSGGAKRRHGGCSRRSRKLRPPARRTPCATAPASSISSTAMLIAHVQSPASERGQDVVAVAGRERVSNRCAHRGRAH